MSESNFDRLERKPAYYAVADTIRKRIVDGDLAQESYLPPEQDFADQLGVTRQTLREAVRLLETSGLITRGKRRRLVVARPTPLAVSGSLLEAMILHDVTYRELIEYHMVTDPGVAALAATKATDADRARLVRNVEWMKSLIDSEQSVLPADSEFHLIVMESTHNRPLQLSQEANIDMLYRTFSRLVNDPDKWQAKRILAAHEHIAEAIRTGDAEVARLWMTRHIEDIRRGCELAGVDMDVQLRPHLGAARLDNVG